jgi:hypothetical protein
MLPILSIIEIGAKVCSVCNTEKPITAFRVRSDTAKQRPFCLSCEAQIQKDRYLLNRSHRLLKQEQRRLEKPVDIMLNQAKARAKKKNLEFNLSAEDIVLPERCKYLDIPLTNIQGHGVVWENYSIDRIDNNKGYIKGNVEIISRKANSMKNMATKEELVTFARNILKLYGE